MKKKASLSLGGLLLAVLAAIFCPQLLHQDGARPPVDAPTTTTAPAPAAAASTVGFTSRASWQAHFDKHGAEFGRITRQDYLRQAQLLRDAKVGGPILETVRRDGVVTRFDRDTGAFIAFNPNGIIRTFFKPNDGERYYRRQSERGSN